MTAIVWFRRDLRLADHSPLAGALATGRPVLPVFVWDAGADAQWSPGAASRVWLHHSLAALAASLAARGNRLLLVRGDTPTALAALARTLGATSLHYNRRREPAERSLEAQVEARFEGRLALDAHDDGLLVPPARLATGGGDPYRVFTPFWRRLNDLYAPRAARAAPARVPAPVDAPAGDSLESLGLLPRVRWDSALVAHWGIGEDAALARLAAFAADGVAGYLGRRDYPALDGVSRLSPALHFGEISPHRAWSAVAGIAAAQGLLSVPEALQGWLRQLAWREFAQHLLHHFPATSDAPLRREFAGFPWVEDADGLARWQRGETGFPIVDAGMRELWQTGWMHNRVRMIVASFLTKDLGVHWREGAAWFWDTLVDADLANNTLGWQWTAGCGADAAPYFRVFNPTLQSAKFDPDGRYLRRWLPELAQLPDADLHWPAGAGALGLAAAGVTLGRTYPAPMLDHGAARKAALERMKRTQP